MAVQETAQNWIQYAALSDVGLRRVNNQDSYSIQLASDKASWSERGHIFMVADGMGAHAAGELASKLAVDGIPHHYHKLRQLAPPEALERAIQETNAEIHRRGRANIDFHNMGTTASVLALLPQGAVAAHVGDSRIYRLQGDRLEQLTFDHSLIWELRAAGQLSEGVDEQERSIPKNVITRSLGPNPVVQIDLEGPFSFQLGDTFLLCSDGLTGLVEDDELGPILAHLPVDEAARVLVDLANLRGGSDNSTAIVVRIAASPPSADGAWQPSLLRRSAAVHPAWWVVAAACGLTALLMAWTEHYMAAGIAAGGALVSVLAAVFQIFSETARWPGRSAPRLGRGPYSQVICRANGRVVKTLAGITEELREAASHQQWSVDWDHFNSLCRQADQSIRQSQYVQALRHYAAAISFMMHELRTQRQKKARDSAIDY